MMAFRTFISISVQYQIKLVIDDACIYVVYHIVIILIRVNYFTPEWTYT